MLKWILGCLGLIVVVVVAVIWFGYRQMSKIAEKGPSATIAIHATPQRVFASLADADSLREWRSDGISASRRGPLMIGDTLKENMRVSTSTDGRKAGSTVLVSTVRPDTVIAFETLNDTSGVVMFTRRDSVVASGDSTLVITTFAAPMLDTKTGQPHAAAQVVGALGNMMVGAMRMQAESEHRKLKARIEGRPVADSTKKP